MAKTSYPVTRAGSCGCYQGLIAVLRDSFDHIRQARDGCHLHPLGLGGQSRAEHLIEAQFLRFAQAGLGALRHARILVGAGLMEHYRRRLDAEELRDTTLNIRMLPIGSTFSKFKRLVRDLSQELGKQIEMETERAETELDKTVIERLNALSQQLGTHIDSTGGRHLVTF